MKQRPSEQTIADVAMIARNGIDRINELERERNKLRDLCDNMFATLTAALLVAPHDSAVRAILESTVAELQPRWLRKEKA